MALQFSTTVRDGRINSIPTTVGTSPILKIRTGSAPATCATSATGTVVATLTLPSTWLAASSSGTAAKSGTWQDLSADATGTAGWWELLDSGGTTRHIQGTVGIGSGDLQVDNTSFATGQAFSITSFSITDGNS
jgi:hypothetical protein